MQKWNLGFETELPVSTYSVSLLIRTSIIRILAYPNNQKQDYNIIHKHFNDIHIVIELSEMYFSMYFTYLNFSVIFRLIEEHCTLEIIPQVANRIEEKSHITIKQLYASIILV